MNPKQTEGMTWEEYVNTDWAGDPPIILNQKDYLNLKKYFQQSYPDIGWTGTEEELDAAVKKIRSDQAFEDLMKRNSKVPYPNRKFRRANK